MIGIVLRRLGLLVPTFLLVSLVAFVAIRMVPGDPVQVRTGERGIAPERHAELIRQLGLDQPVWKQYLDYLGQLAGGDFGASLTTRVPVLQEFATLFPATAELTLLAMLFAVLLGIPAGILAATRRGSLADHGVMAVAATGYSMPVFWWGFVAILLFSVQLGWTPVAGRIGLAYYVPAVTGFMLIDSLISGVPGSFASAARHLVLPAIVLGTIPLAAIARMTRSAMLEVLGEDYVRTARAKGLHPLRVLTRHTLRAGLAPVLTLLGLYGSSLLAGAALTEYVFSWPGVGNWLIQAIAARDYPVLQGGILLISVVVVGLGLAVDLACRALDPRGRDLYWPG